MQKRHVMVALCALCTLLNYADRVNMSVVILPMAQYFNWSTSAQATVLSSFFAGYLLMQVGGALLARRFGAKAVLAYGATLWSLFTALTPVFAELGFYPLLLCRFGMGLSEGVAFPAIYHFLAGWIPPTERGRAISLTLTGVHCGTTVALVVSPQIVHRLGWEAVFHIFGASGVFWIASWLVLASDRDPDAARLEEKTLHLSGDDSYTALPIESEDDFTLSRSSPSSPKMALYEVPLTPDASKHGSSLRSKGSLVTYLFSPTERRAIATIFSSPPCLAVCFTQFSLNLAHYVVLSWLPTYFRQVYGVDIKSLSFTAVPYISMAIFCSCGGIGADYLASRGMPLTRVRKVVMTVSCSGAAAFFVMFSIAPTVPVAIFAITVGLVFMSLGTGGFEASYMDMASPSLAGTFKSVANTLGATSGFVSMPYTTTVLWMLGGSWRGLFGSLALYHIAALAVFNRYATSDRILTEDGIRCDLPS